MTVLVSLKVGEGHTDTQDLGGRGEWYGGEGHVSTQVDVVGSWKNGAGHVDTQCFVVASENLGAQL